MREKMNKSEYLKKLATEIEHRELIETVFNGVFQEVLNAFDGKVYNKRFINALNEKLKAIDPFLYAKEESAPSKDMYSNYKDDLGVNIIICCRFSSSNYVDKEYNYTKVIISPSSYRIDAEKSRTEKYTLCWHENFIKGTEEKKQVLKDYNKYLKVAAKVAESIKAFSELPSSFRENISFSNSFYISYR